MILPEGHDPDTFVRAEGAGALFGALEDATGLLNFYVDQTVARHSDSPAGKSRAAQEVLAVIGRVEGRTRRYLLRQALAQRLGVSEESLVLAERRREFEPMERGGVPEETVTDFEIEVLRLVLLHPEIGANIFAADLGPHFIDPWARAVYESMAGQARRFGRVDADRLIEELESDQVDLVTGLALSDDGLADEDLGRVAADYIKRFDVRSRRLKARELSRRIKDAQTAGDEAGLKNLLQEKNRLLKENTLL